MFTGLLVTRKTIVNVPYHWNSRIHGNLWSSVSTGTRPMYLLKVWGSDQWVTMLRKADRFLGSAQNSHGCFLAAKCNYREIQKSQTLWRKKMFIYLHLYIYVYIYLYLSEYSKLNQILIQKRLHKPSEFPIPPFVATLETLDFPCMQNQIFLECWERSQFLWNWLSLGL